MKIIEFYFNDKLLAISEIKDMSTQIDRDIVAKKCLDDLDYQTFNKFVIREEDETDPNPLVAELTGYFQDSQGRIWKVKDA